MIGATRSTSPLVLRTGSKMRFEKVTPFLLFAVCAAGGKVSALAPLRRPQNAAGTHYGGALGPEEDGGLRADHQSLHTGPPADYREASTSFSEANPTANRMQAVLDKLCGIFFNDLCTLGVQPFCNGDAVARYGAGKADTKDEAWRCYAGKTLGNSETKMQCIDDCGYTFPCEGNANSDSLYLTLERPLQEMPAKITKSTCPQSQRALNQYCATFGEDHVARFSSTPKSSQPSWRCFKKTTLLFSTTSECGGHCKNKLVACPGGIPPNAGAEDVIYYTRATELQTALSTAPDPCPGQTCLERSTQGVCS